MSYSKPNINELAHDYVRAWLLVSYIPISKMLWLWQNFSYVRLSDIIDNEGEKLRNELQ